MQCYPQWFAIKFNIHLQVPKHAIMDKCGDIYCPWMSVHFLLELAGMKRTRIGSLQSMGRVGGLYWQSPVLTSFDQAALFEY